MKEKRDTSALSKANSYHKRAIVKVSTSQVPIVSFISQPMESSDQVSRKRAANSDSTSSPPASAHSLWNKKKDSDMPKRPLSAYNIFFQDERQRILEDMNVSQHLLLQQGGLNAAVDQKQQPKPQVRFAELSRHIAAKWNDLGDDAKGLYQALAEKEQNRYAREMIYWNAQRGLQKSGEEKQAADSPGSSASTSAARREDETPSLLGPWQDATMGRNKSGAAAGVNLSNTKIEQAPSMRPASPLRYALDSLPLFSATLPGKTPATALHWSKFHQSKPIGLPLAVRAEPQRSSPQQQEAKLPSPPLTALLGGPSARPFIKPQISRSLKQLSDDLDDEEQDFLISSLAGDHPDSSEKKKAKRGR